MIQFEFYHSPFCDFLCPFWIFHLPFWKVNVVAADASSTAHKPLGKMSFRAWFPSEISLQAKFLSSFEGYYVHIDNQYWR